MVLRLEEFRDLHADLGAHAQERLAASWQEATRVMSITALEGYLKGARALHALGRGPEPVTHFIRVAPEIARELGEDAVAQLVQAALTLAGRTSGAVVSLVIATAPAAARRLADPELFRAYLDFLDKLQAQAPRALRPLLERLDALLAQLTLGGLRRWAWRGVHAHRHDFAAQEAYFSLTGGDSRAVLQQERKGTLFVDVQRRIAMYLRALWGRSFLMRPTAGDFETREGLRPYVEEFILHVPDAYDDLMGAHGPIDGLARYRAACAHGAAHLVYTSAPMPADGLNALQRAAIELVEDARVEALAQRHFPGLGALWRSQHGASSEQAATLGDWLSRLARALLDPAYADPHPLVCQARLWFAERQAHLERNEVSWEVGLALAEALRRLGLPHHPGADCPSALYRDDNRYLWHFQEAHALARLPARERQVRRRVGLMEFVNALDVETAGDDAQEIWTLDGELYDDDGSSFNQREGKAARPEAFHYGEWDYQIQAQRPAWCTVLEKPAPAGAAAAMDAWLAHHKPLAARLRRMIEALRPQGLQRLRRQEDGDDLDLDAAVRAAVDLRLGTLPDPRIGLRHRRRRRDVALLLLLDLSRSTNERAGGGEHTVLELSQQAALLLADALARLGDPFAVHGFCSDGRDDVSYYRLKDFAEPFAGAAKARLAGLRGALSTRMGAALRHAGHHLARRPQRRKLLLVLTDGEPADVDVRDPRYLRADARKAVEELTRRGITSFCFSLDAQADRYVSEIFGERHYFILDHIQRLPLKLPLLYLGLTR
jgi:hypothetical protein